MSSQVTLEANPLLRMEKLLGVIQKKGGNVEKPLKQWGVYQLAMVGKAFASGGRGKNIWPRLKESTIAGRKLRKRGSGRTNPNRILQDTGAYKRSWKTKGKLALRGEPSQSVFTENPIAPIHQDGATIKARTIKPKKPGGVLRFWFKGAITFSKIAHIGETIIPKRAVAIEDQDVRQAVNITLKHLRETVETGIKKSRGLS